MRTDRDSTLRLRRGIGLALSALALMTAPAVQAQNVGAAAVARFKAPDLGDRAGAQAAAEQGLADYVQRKQQQGGAGATAFDLPRAGDLANTRIAGGFEVHTIAPQDIAAGRSELRHMVQASGIWRFFVKVGTRPVGLVTVQRMDGRWQAVSFGGAGLAQELSELMAEHADVGADHLRFIRVHQAQTDLLEVVSPTDLQARYAPLASARAALSTEAPATTSKLLDTYELLEPLRNAVKRNLNGQN
ncbi:hypothetical protein ACS5PN_03180 [Roseateles sp. NT4]|uniref:hypothetical protein n=1 Tax=Roseateles sp. NT4 TaxID=3453715 RepID=UPI003EEF11E2